MTALPTDEAIRRALDATGETWTHQPLAGANQRWTCPALGTVSLVDGRIRVKTKARGRWRAVSLAGLHGVDWQAHAAPGWRDVAAIKPVDRARPWLYREYADMGDEDHRLLIPDHDEDWPTHGDVRTLEYANVPTAPVPSEFEGTLHPLSPAQWTATVITPRRVDGWAVLVVDSVGRDPHIFSWAWHDDGWDVIESQVDDMGALPIDIADGITDTSRDALHRLHTEQSAGATRTTEPECGCDDGDDLRERIRELEASQGIQLSPAAAGLAAKCLSASHLEPSQVVTLEIARRKLLAFAYRE